MPGPERTRRLVGANIVGYQAQGSIRAGEQPLGGGESPKPDDAEKGNVSVSDRISIVIAEDSLLVRDSVARALSVNPDMTVVGVAEDYDSAVELVETHAPTILFTDVRMPPTSTDEGIRLARWMRTATS